MTAVTDEPIALIPHDPAWSVRFQRERRLLERTIGSWVVGEIHHVGSTAVPGLDAKPVIDILAGVLDLEASRDCFQPLGEIGYLYAPYKSEEMHWFCKPHPSRREYHLHLVPANSARFRDELSFRDRLRAKPEIAREYAAVKHSLAACFPNDREAYTEAKSDFIAHVLMVK
jgi:GrpB-like predicted nucleotidyltransferase (UPF0157 family)